MSWFFSWLANLFAGNAKLSKLVVKIQAATVKACGFLPMAETVAALVAAGNPAVTTATVIANKICRAVTNPTPPMILYGGGVAEPAKPTVDGVVIEGEFVNPKKDK